MSGWCVQRNAVSTLKTFLFKQKRINLTQELSHKNSVSTCFAKKTKEPVILQNILHKLREKSCSFCYSSNKLFRLHSKCKTKLFADVKKHWKVLRKMINSFKAKQNNWHIIFEATEWGWIFMILLKLLLRKKLIILKKKNIFLIYIF